MGLYDRDYTQYDRQYGENAPQYGGGMMQKPAWLIILIATVAIYLVDMLLFNREHQLHNAMVVREDTLTKPWMWWQWITYAFAHDTKSFFHILFNMMGLFFFGSAVEQRLGSGEFTRFYLVAALLGGIVHSLFFQLGVMAGAFDGLMAMFGASGAVNACVILFCFMFPHGTIYLMMVVPVKAWVAGILFVAIDTYGALSGAGGTAFDVHLTGAAFAAVYWLGKLNLKFLAPANWSDLTSKLPKRRPKLRLHDPESKLAKEEAEADRILRKIHEEGEASLTSAERKTLERYSRRIRNNRS